MDSSKCMIICERDENDKKFQCNAISCQEIPGNAINTIVEDNIKTFKSTDVTENENQPKKGTSIYLVLLIIFLICIFAKLMKIF